MIGLTVEQAIEYKKCAKDVTYFTRHYVWIKHITMGAIKWAPYPGATTDPCWQIKLLKDMQDGKNLIVLKSRQVGASWTVAIYVAWMMHFRPNIEMLLLSQKEKKAIKLLSKVKFISRRLPDWMQREISSDTKTSFALVHKRRNGAIVSETLCDSLTTTGDSGRGDSAAFVFLDEFARLDNAEETWTAIKPTTSHGGQIVAASSPMGKVGPFPRIYMMADSGDSATFEARRVHYTDCGFGEDWLRSASDGMTDTQIAQEFELAFLGSGSPAFNPVDVQACYYGDGLPEELFELVGKSKKFATGVDSAEIKRRSKLSQRDFNAITSLNEFGIQIAAQSNKLTLDEWAGKTLDVGNDERVEVMGFVSKWHKRFPGLMFSEENGAGLTVANRHILPNDDVSEFASRRTTAKSKPRLVNQFYMALAGRLIAITDKNTYYQLLMYEDLGNNRYEAPQGWNDDLVIAIMNAYDALIEMGGYEFDLPDGVDSIGAIRTPLIVDDSFHPDSYEVPDISEFMPGNAIIPMQEAFADLDPRSVRLGTRFDQFELA